MVINKSYKHTPNHTQPFTTPHSLATLPTSPSTHQSPLTINSRSPRSQGRDHHTSYLHSRRRLPPYWREGEWEWCCQFQDSYYIYTCYTYTHSYTYTYSPPLNVCIRMCYEDVSIFLYIDLSSSVCLSSTRKIMFLWIKMFLQIKCNN